MPIFISIFNSSSKSRLPKKQIELGIKNTLLGESIHDATISVIYLDDDELRELNKTHLNHDYNTDVITFPLSEEEEELEGEIYISVETATIQAEQFKVTLANELLRLAIHGTLHLAGYDDSSAEQKEKMTCLEDKYINETINKV